METIRGKYGNKVNVYANTIEEEGLYKINLLNPNMAYIIGLLQTDGSYYCQSRNRGRICIELKIEDIDILYKIKKILNCNSDVKKRIRDTNFCKNYTSCSFSIFSINIRKELSKYIPVGKKSEIICMPHEISEIDYWRGIIDGDGSLGLTKNNIPFISLTTKSENLANSYRDFVEKHTNYRIKSERNDRDKIYNLMLTKEKAQIITNLLYYDECLCLNRKFKSSIDVKKWIRPKTMRIKIWNVQKWTQKEDEFILNHELLESMKYLNRTKKSVQTRLYRLKYR